MDLASIVFYLFSTVLVVSSLLVISSRNPVHSVLFLIFSFFNAAALFVLIGAEYIAMTLVIVYVGAVAVLFLFVVMMIDIDVAAMRQGFLKYLPMGGGAALILLGQFYFLYQAISQTTPQVLPASSPIPAASEVSNTAAIGHVLYTDYIYAFQLSGVILLVAMIGAIVLTHREPKNVRKQRIGKQVSRKRSDAMEIVKVTSGEGA
jgi:NADH-quinone oxidoreductase subunit J